MSVAGIDPGIGGAVALLDPPGAVRIEDMPLEPKRHGRGHQVSAVLLAGLLAELRPAHVYVEQVGTMPGQGVTGVLSIGRSAGVIDGVLAALGIPAIYVAPSRWKRAAGLLGRCKDDSRRRALELHPGAASFLTRKKDHGRAEPLLLAWFGARGHDDPGGSTA